MAARAPEPVHRVCFVSPSVAALGVVCDDRHVTLRRDDSAGLRAVDDEGFTVDAVVWQDPALPWRGGLDALYYAAAHEATKWSLDGGCGYVLVTGTPRSGKSTVAINVLQGATGFALSFLVAEQSRHKRDPNARTGVWSLSMSAMSVREDKVYDMIRAARDGRAAERAGRWVPPRDREEVPVKVHRTAAQGTWVDGLGETPIRSDEDLRTALEELSYACDGGHHHHVVMYLNVSRHVQSDDSNTTILRGRLTIADLASDRDAAHTEHFSHQSSSVNVSVTTLRRLIRAASRNRDTAAGVEVLPVRDSALNKLLSSAFEDAALTAVVTAIGGDCTTSIAGILSSMHDLRDADNLTTTPAIDQAARYSERHGLNSHVVALANLLGEAERQEAHRLCLSEALAVPLPDDTELAARRRVLHELSQHCSVADEALRRTQLANEEQGARRMHMKNWISGVPMKISDRTSCDSTARVTPPDTVGATSQPAEPTVVTADASTCCNFDAADDEAREERQRAWLAELDRVAKHLAIVKASRRRRRRMQFFAAACERREQQRTAALWAARHEHASLSSLCEKARDRVAMLEARKASLMSLDDRETDLSAQLKQLTRKTMEAIHDRDAAIQVAQSHLHLEAVRASFAKQLVAEADRALEVERAAFDAASQPLRHTVEAREAELGTSQCKLSHVSAALTAEEAAAKLLLLELDQHSERAAAHSDSIRELEVADAAQRSTEAEVGEENATTRAEAMESERQLLQLSLALEAVREALGAVSRNRRSRVDLLLDAQKAVRAHGLPDADRHEYPKAAPLAAVVVDSEHSAKLVAHDCRVPVALQLRRPDMTVRDNASSRWRAASAGRATEGDSSSLRSQRAPWVGVGSRRLAVQSQ